MAHNPCANALIQLPKYTQTPGPHPVVDYTVDVLCLRPEEHHMHMECDCMTCGVRMTQERHLCCRVESGMEK